ncbi:MAG: SoxR reducing system RseC family protein [Fluviibacter sp.]
MAEREAQVIEVIPSTRPEVPGLARLQFDVSGGCGRCHETGGCGGVSIAQPLCSTPKTLLVVNDVGVQLGDKVLVTIPDALLSQGITRAYLIPLILLFVGSALGALLLPDLTPVRWQLSSDIGAMAGAGLGLIAAWWQLQRNQQTRAMVAPRILCRLN